MTSPNPKTPPDTPGAPSLLDRIKGPRDVRALSVEDLEKLAAEVRQEIITTVAANGGHLASPLGAVDLTLALHHVYDFEKDLVIFDVGHQAYAHKLLTGRREAFRTLRTRGGISGYPRREESRYDAFGTGHSSTSISAALGMAVARDRRGEKRNVIAVIGDGAMTGGMAFEALSNAGQIGADLLVILNDNEMSISKNVGALSAYFSRLITGGLYNRAKEDIQSFMTRMLGSQLTKAAQRLEQSVKGFLTPGAVFQELGFKYVGPVDGHDLHTLVDCFANVKQLTGPILFHCVTQKGKGYQDAENDPQKYHGVSPYQIVTGECEGEARPAVADRDPVPVRTFNNVFGAAMVHEAEHDPRVAAITAAMPAGTGLSLFQERFPDRFFDVGICEQHAVTFAAGLAAQGMRPVVALYSTFLQRGYDQLIHDVCLQKLPVVFAIDRAGLVGEDGPTHLGAFDLSFLRAVPNIAVLAPRDGADLRNMLHWALRQDGPVALRYARGPAPSIGPAGSRDITHAEVLRKGGDAVLLGVGPCLGACLEAAESLENEGLSVAVADARRVKPLDAALLADFADIPIITVEENALNGGFGAAVIEHYERHGLLDVARVRRLGLPDRFMNHATRAEQLAEAGLDAPGIAAAVGAFVAERSHHAVR